jgi:hypothetical protein
MGTGTGGTMAAAQDTPKLSELKVQTMGYGVAIPIPYGSVRLNPTLGYSRDFKATPHEEEGGRGGKGAGGGGGGTVYYTYTVCIIYFACEGPIRGYGRIWRDKMVYDSVLNSGFLYETHGTTNQLPYGYIQTAHADEALNYRRTALLAAGAYNLGSDGHLGNHAFEVFGHQLSATPADQNYTDAHIKDVIDDFLTHPVYGAVDARTATIPLSMDAMHAYCVARDLLISPLVGEQRPAHEYLSEWAKVANAGIVWSEGQLKFLPYSDTAASNAFGSYVPDTAVRATFDADNVLEPIRPARKKPADCFNQVTVEFESRGRAYNKHSVESKDLGSIAWDGMRPATTRVLNCIRIRRTALIVAHTEMLRGLYIRNTYTIKTTIGGEADLLEPLDFIQLTDAALGLNHFRARITSITDNPGGELTIVAEEAPEGIYHG